MVDNLPPGFAYLPSSTTGTLTADPQVSGQSLTWSGPIDVAPHTEVRLHFRVRVLTSTGTYMNSVTGTAVQTGVVATGSVAPVRVTAALDAGAVDAASLDAATPDGQAADSGVAGVNDASP